LDHLKFAGMFALGGFRRSWRFFVEGRDGEGKDDGAGNFMFGGAGKKACAGKAAQKEGASHRILVSRLSRLRPGLVQPRPEKQFARLKAAATKPVASGRLARVPPSPRLWLTGAEKQGASRQ
jgi:hypothetical protein